MFPQRALLLTASGGRLFNLLMARGKKDSYSFGKRSCRQEVGVSPDGSSGWLLLTD